ncbi:MAG: hypothetical protein Q7T29_01170 [Gallionella sp.]|nr:hypothetical protein [Gallionella sp.]
MKQRPKKLASPIKTVAVTSEVSQNCDTRSIKFKIFVSATGSDALQQYIDGLDPAVIQKFKTRVKYLKNIPVIDWKTFGVKKLKGFEILEIKLDANKKEHRPLGYFGPGKNEFTILEWATHKQDIYDPHNAIKTANSRRTFVENGSASCVPLKIDGEEFPNTEES